MMKYRADLQKRLCRWIQFTEAEAPGCIDSQAILVLFMDLLLLQ